MSTWGSGAGGASDGPLLSLRGAWRTYPGPTLVHGLRDVTLDIRRGELIGLVGRSGAGKSTLLNLIGLLDRPTRGTYSLAGTPTTGLSERAQTRLRSRFFGFVFQQPFLIARRTALENVELALLPRHKSRRERRARAQAALDSVGLAERRGFMPATLSGGEAQRVSLARAIAQDPAVLLCDEPTGNLDERTSAEILAVIRAINGSGTTVVIATHDLALAGSLPRLLSVRDGAVSEGPDDFAAASGLLNRSAALVRRQPP